MGSTDRINNPDPVPRWRAMFNIFLNRRRRPVLADSGATFLCKLSTRSLGIMPLGTKRPNLVALPAQTVVATRTPTTTPSGEVAEQDQGMPSTSGLNNAGDSSAQSLQSATELDVAFLGDSQQSSLDDSHCSPGEQRCQTRSPKNPGFVSAPSSPTRNPPPHPITMGNSPEYHSPAHGSSPAPELTADSLNHNTF